VAKWLVRWNCKQVHNTHRYRPIQDRKTMSKYPAFLQIRSQSLLNIQLTDWRSQCSVLQQCW